MNKTNVVLIGMAGAGKSTVGVVLAKRLGLDFLDTDVLIQARLGRRLQEIIDSEGLAAFRQIEEAALLSLSRRRTVVATGGSAIYSEAGMAALKTYGTIVFLDTPLEDLMLRIRDLLLVTYQGNEEKLSEWGFKVVVGQAKTKAKEA